MYLWALQLSGNVQPQTTSNESNERDGKDEAANVTNAEGGTSRECRACVRAKCVSVGIIRVCL